LTPAFASRFHPSAGDKVGGSLMWTAATPFADLMKHRSIALGFFAIAND
jgi:hypothetical protein